MTGASIEIIGNTEGVERMLMVLEVALSPSALVAGFLGQTVDPYLRKRARSRFQNEGDDVVGRWAPLKESTQQYRADAGYGPSHPINRRTGEMENYVTDSPNALTTTPSGAVLTLPGNKPQGVLKDKMSIAQIGGGEYNTVPRPVLGMNEADLAFVMTELAYYIEKVGAAII